MSTPLSDEQQAAIDRRFPIIAQGTEPPGPRSATRSWRTRHGPTLVWWSNDQPIRVDDALYPDGARGIVRHTSDHGWRRQAPDGRSWIYGSIDVRPDDVTFTDGAQPVYTPPPQTDVPNLEADLARDPAFLAALQDDRFANAVYASFNRSFFKGDDERPWSGGLSSTAAMLAHLRGRGESYQDWYPYGGLTGVYPDDRPEREASLRQSLEHLSKPIELTRMVPSSVPDAQREAALRQLEAQRAEFERQRPRMEADRAKLTETINQALANLHENADVFDALHAHLTRLGWRVEGAQDRARQRRLRIERRVAVLQDIKQLEQRLAGDPGDWTAPLRARQGALSGPLSEVMTRGREKMSADESEVVGGGVERRLTNLALTGRVTKEEYDGLAARLGLK